MNSSVELRVSLKLGRWYSVLFTNLQHNLELPLGRREVVSVPSSCACFDNVLYKFFQCSEKFSW